MLQKLLSLALFLGLFFLLPTTANAATFTVDSTGDQSDVSTNGLCATSLGTCTLRAAITEVNAAAGPHTINFNIPTSDGGYLDYDGGAGDGLNGDDFWRLTPATALATITATSVTINGATQTSNQGDTNTTGPEIQIHGSAATIATGLAFSSAATGATVNSVIVSLFTTQVSFSGSNSTITNSYINVDPKSLGTYTSKTTGIAITSTANNIIIGNTTSDGNVIAANGVGISLACGSGGARTSTIAGNFIGMGKDPSYTSIATAQGIAPTGDCQTVIGGDTASNRNYFGGAGVAIPHAMNATATPKMEIYNNYFGTDPTATLNRSISRVTGQLAGGGIHIDANNQYIIGASGKGNLFSHATLNHLLINTHLHKFDIAYNTFANTGSNAIGISSSSSQNLNGSSIHHNFFGVSSSDPYFGVSTGAVTLGAISLTNMSNINITNNIMVNSDDDTQTNNRGITLTTVTTPLLIDSNDISHFRVGIAGGTSGFTITNNSVHDNTQYGIALGVSPVTSSNSTITGNTITDNGYAGLYVGLGSGKLIQDNIIYDNYTRDTTKSDIETLLGTGSVSANGVIINDPGDPDSGANDQQNYPEIQHVEYLGSSVYRVSGRIDGKVSEAPFTIEICKSNNAVNQNGGCIESLGTTVTGSSPDSQSGASNYFNWTDDVTVSGSNGEEQVVFTTLVTNNANSTSQFSQNFITPGDAIPVSNGDGTYTITVTSIETEDNVSIAEYDNGGGSYSGGGAYGEEGIADGESTLREALIVASQFSEPVTIVFDSSITTLTPTQNIDIFSGTNLVRDIIDGTGVIVDGTSLTDEPCFNVIASENLTITNFTFENCPVAIGLLNQQETGITIIENIFDTTNSSDVTPINHTQDDCGLCDDYQDNTTGVDINDEHSTWNWPEITSVVYLGAETYRVSGDILESIDEDVSPFDIEVCKSDSHSSGHGGCIETLGHTEANSPWTLDVVIPGADGTELESFTALSTNVNGSTAEFGNNFEEYSILEYPVELVYPINGQDIEATTPVLDWNPSAFEGFENPEVDHYNVYLDDVKIAETPDDVTYAQVPNDLGFSYGTTHTWRVEAIRGASLVIGESTEETFDVVAPQYNFENVYPVDVTIDDTTPLFDWTDVPPDSVTDYYEVWVDDEKLAEIEIGSEYQSEDSLSEGVHEWYVKALDQDSGVIAEVGRTSMTQFTIDLLDDGVLPPPEDTGDGEVIEDGEINKPPITGGEAPPSENPKPTGNKNIFSSIFDTKGFKPESLVPAVGIVAATATIAVYTTFLTAGKDILEKIGFVIGGILPKKRRYWGIVFDALKSQGIPFAVIRVYDSNNRLINTTVTDLDGRYGIPVSSLGDYKLEVKAQGFEPFAKNIILRNGELQEIVENLPLQRVGEKLDLFRSFIFYHMSEILNAIRIVVSVLMLIGFAYSIYIFIQFPILLNLIVLVLYLGLFVLNGYQEYKHRRNVEGRVIDLDNKLGLPNATIILYNSKGEQEDLRLTNSKGVAKLRAKTGLYEVHSLKSGYSMSDVESGKLSLELKVDERGYLTKAIFMKRV